MTTIYLIRHGQAEGNLYRRCHSWHNGLLTQKGREQAKALEKRFEGVHFDAAYSSDLYRAMATAGAVSRPRGLTLRVDPGLREIGAGVWEDVPWGQLLHEHRDSLADFLACDPGWQVEGSETFPHVRQRMTASLTRIAAAHPGQTVAVASHGCAIRAALSAFLGMDAADMSRIPLSNNTGVAKLMAENGTFQVEYYNDDSHLGSSEQWRYPAAQPNASSGIPGMERNALRHRSLILPQEEDLYLNACTEAGIQPYNFLLGEPDSLLLSLLGERPAGVLQMDRAKEADQGAGWITLLWMAPEFQGKGLAVQLLGHAVCTYRAMGRQTLRLSCPPEFQRLRSFCLSHGFAPADGQPDTLETYIGLEL